MFGELASAPLGGIKARLCIHRLTQMNIRICEGFRVESGDLDDRLSDRLLTESRQQMHLSPTRSGVQQMMPEKTANPRAMLLKAKLAPQPASEPEWVAQCALSGFGTNSI